MSKFQPGQRVICVRTFCNDQGLEMVKEGMQYIISDFRDWRCPCKVIPIVDVGLRTNQVKHYCKECNKNAFYDDVIWIPEENFAPLEEDTDVNKMVEVSFSKVKEYAPIGAN